jgi:hypothetical protein
MRVVSPAWISNVWHVVRRGARVIRNGLSVIIIVIGVLIAGFFGEPVIRRCVDLAEYVLASRQSPLPADERLLQSLEQLYGKTRASRLSTLIMLGAMPLDLGDRSAAEAELDSVANTSPGGNLYWIPTAQNVQDSYGLMLATLFEAENGNYYQKKRITGALDEFLSSAKQSQPVNDLSLLQRANDYVARTPPKSKKEVKSQMRQSATSLGIALKDAPEKDILANDLRLYLALAGLDDKATVTVPGILEWLKGPHDPMEIIARGELEITVFASPAPGTTQTITVGATPSAAGAPPPIAVSATQPSAGDKQSVTVDATLYGRQAKFFEFSRPTWFKDIHIQKAKELAKRSESLAPFFGVTGALREVPLGVWVEKEPLYEFEVAAVDRDKVVTALSQPGSSVAVQFPGGRILAPGAQASRIGATNWWQLTPADARARVVALVSEQY